MLISVLSAQVLHSDSAHCAWQENHSNTILQCLYIFTFNFLNIVHLSLCYFCSILIKLQFISASKVSDMKNFASQRIISHINMPFNYSILLLIIVMIKLVSLFPILAAIIHAISYSNSIQPFKICVTKVHSWPNFCDMPLE